MDKKNDNKCSLRNEKLKANRASKTEEQKKERLRIRHEKDRARRRLRNIKPRLWSFTRPLMFQHSILVKVIKVVGCGAWSF